MKVGVWQFLMWGQNRLYQEDNNWVKTCRSQGNGLTSSLENRHSRQKEQSVPRPRECVWSVTSSESPGDSTVRKATCTSPQGL